MKLKTLILPLLCGGFLCSCSAVYEDDNLCPQGADVKLTFRNNVELTDRFDSEAHCAKVLLYDSDGRFCDIFDYDSSRRLTLNLPEGDYRAFAFGGMWCDQADFDFINELSPRHHYSELRTGLKASRAAGSSSRDLHPHFYGNSFFSVKIEDMKLVPVNIDLTKNTNRFRIVLRYSDGSPISPDDFNFSIAADNSMADYENKPMAQEEDWIYLPYETGEAASPVAEAWADLSVARLASYTKAHLTVKPQGSPSPAIDIDLIPYLDQIHNRDLPGASLQEYLDRQGSWTLEFTLDHETDKFTGLSFTINNWEVIVNSFDL